MVVSTTRLRCLVAFSLLEILLFGGLIFGWSSLVFVLKAEGLFEELCTDKVNTSLIDTQTAENVTNKNIGDDDDVGGNCFQQDDRFNLMFSIGVASLYATHILTGQMYYKLGTKKTRIIIIALYVLGLFFLAIASPDLPWLILPGITLIGIAGISMLLSNMQVAILLSKWSPIYLGMASGFFNSSVLTQRVVKELFESGINRSYSFSAIAIMMVVISGATTACFPSKGDVKSDGPKANDSKAREIEITLNKEIAIVVEEQQKQPNLTNNHTDDTDKQISNVKYSSATQDSNVLQDIQKETQICVDDQPTFRQVIKTRKYILQVSWFSIMLLRLFYYLGSINNVMEKTLDSRDQVSYFTDVMAYTMMGGFIASFTSGQLLHCQNVCCTESLSKVLPISLTSGLAVLLSAMTFVTSSSALYGTFIILTIFRSYVFSVNMDFIISSFPKKFASILYGLQCTIAGLISLLQYALFVWAEGYHDAEKHVNGVLLGLSILSLVQPLYLFVDARRKSSKKVSQ